MTSIGHGYSNDGLAGRHIRILTDESSLRALKPDWDDLYRRSADPHYSQSFDWCWCGWMTVAKPRGRKLLCVVATDANQVVLIWPLVVGRTALWSVARPLGSETTEYSNVLVEGGAGADARMDLAWQALKQAPGCDVLRLPYVRERSALDRLISGQSAFSFADDFTIAAVNWRGAPTWEAYYRSLDKKQRLDISRRRRRLMESGDVAFAASVDADQQSAVIDWIIDQKKQWLVRKERRNHWLETDDYRRFLVAVAERTKREDRIIVSALKLDGAVIAAAIARKHGTRIETFLSAFDPSYHKFSPSHILYEGFLEWCFERRLEVDFRIGNERFKDHWHLHKSRASSYDIALSSWGTAFVLLKRARHRWSGFKKTLRQTSGGSASAAAHET
jgi:CelD/BcsL family acetyltransferase involved in cellulose biosynthesis